MLKTLTTAATLVTAIVPAILFAQTEPVDSMATPPTLIVAISIDQFSADLFAEYRNRFTGGFARLLDGAVFPSGYQSHAATETCPGHSTLLTGMRPARTGIVLNNWIDLKSPLADKTIYCVEDETVSANTHEDYSVAATHLLVPTLGERIKRIFPASRNVSVSGKDRAAVMMGGRATDEIWWWSGETKGFTSFAGRSMPAVVRLTNASINADLGKARPALPMPGYCVSRSRAIAIGEQTVGAGRLSRAAGDAEAFRTSPDVDNATFALAAGLVTSMKLGQRGTPDLLNVSLSATDYIGHSYGMQGSEMCVQLASLDQHLGAFFKALDATGVDYAVVLSADHGGIDLPERGGEEGSATTRRSRFDMAAVIRQSSAEGGVPAAALHAQDSNVYIDPAITGPQRARLVSATRAAILAQPDVAAVFTADEIEAAPEPSGPPETWPLLMRAKASFYRPRSGDLIFALQPRVVSRPTGKGYVAGHGSFWDYDRRVPILFWRRGMSGFEQPLSVETVDIAPTLAGLLRLPLAAPAMDGRCLDLDPGLASTCR